MSNRSNKAACMQQHINLLTEDWSKSSSLKSQQLDGHVMRVIGSTLIQYAYYAWGEESYIFCDDLAKRVIPGQDYQHFLIMLKYLMGCRQNVFEVGFVLVDDEDREFVLDKSVVNLAKQGKPIPHPVTGAMIEEPKKNIYLIVSQSQYVLNNLV